MSVNFQIAVDAADPHSLADFWAEALHWAVEENEDQIKSLLAQGFCTEEDVTTHNGRLVWKTGSAIRDPEAEVDGRGAPIRARIIFQSVPEPKTVKDRQHLDFHFAGSDRDAEVERLVGLGATRLWEGRQGPHTWVTLADPEGNEFCVS